MHNIPNAWVFQLEPSRRRSGGEYLDGQTEMDSPSISDKARRTPCEAVQSAILITDIQPATTSDNACPAFLWRLTGMLKHMNR